MSEKLTINGTKLYMNDTEFHIHSGAVHYFRIHPSQWRDRLKKLKDCGLNTVETYIAWNMQEPEPGVFVKEGMADFEEFIKIAQELGLYIIVRPGPYICAEWEMGGFPSWLLAVEGIELRHYNEQYLKYVKRYLEWVIGICKPYFSTNGGKIIAMQIENEFGGFGSPDEKYLSYLKKIYENSGVDVLMFTSDGTWNNCLADGSIDGVLMTANFGSRTENAFAELEKLRPGEPKCCMEFWNGWFDQWGTEHHTREAASAVEELKKIMELDGNFNIYMFSGGTNFGFMNGSNCNPVFEPCITSYDYGASLTENGEITEQYRLIKELLTGNGEAQNDTKAVSYGKITDFNVYGIFDNASAFGKTLKNSSVKSMEDVGQRFGYIMYEADVEGMSGKIDIGEPRDRAMFYADNELIGAYERGREYEPVYVEGAKKLRILIENMGRVNYGPRVFDKKGLLENAKIGDSEITSYDITSYGFDFVPEMQAGLSYPQPAVYTAEFEVSEIADTYLKPTGFTHGVVFINGFNLGRYRHMGPQQTLYVPGGILKSGKNKIEILDLYTSNEPEAEFLDRAVLDELNI